MTPNNNSGHSPATNAIVLASTASSDIDAADVIFGRLPSAPFENIFKWFEIRFRGNRFAAMLVFLAFLSGGSRHAFGIRLLGPSSAGKSFLARFAANLLPDNFVTSASRVTRAALFGLANIRALLLDEFSADADVRAVFRQLISQGNCTQIVSTPSGEPKILEVRGPVAVVDLQLDETEAEGQDANRVIGVAMDDSDDQSRFHAECAAASPTTSAMRDEACDERLSRGCQKFIAGLRVQDVRVILNQSPLIVPATGPLPMTFPRRINLLGCLASTIALLNQRNRQSDGSGNIIAENSDLERAFELLLGARVSEDRAENTGAEIDFFIVVFAVLQNEKKGLTIDQIIQKLNDDKVCHARIAPGVTGTHASARPLSPSSKIWTRRMVEKPLKKLRDTGLLIRTEGRKPFLWSLTQAGQSYGAMGPKNSFEVMFAAWQKATANSPASTATTPS